MNHKTDRKTTIILTSYVWKLYFFLFWSYLLIFKLFQCFGFIGSLAVVIFMRFVKLNKFFTFFTKTQEKRKIYRFWGHSEICILTKQIDHLFSFFCNFSIHVRRVFCTKITSREQLFTTFLNFLFFFLRKKWT